jgi:replicative DNA helicase
MAERAILEVAHEDSRKDFRSIEQLLDAELDKLQKLSLEGTAITGTPSGFEDLDNITGGFQPGNLIILAARPAMGKCLAGGTLVPDPRTGARVRIDELVGRVERGQDAFVASLGPDFRLRPARVGAGRRSGVQPVFRLVTRLGRRLEATANHPLLTIDGWRRLDELSPGSRVAVPRRLPVESAPSAMPDHEVVLLAALIADGSLTERTPRFSYGPDSPVVDTVREAAAAMGLRLHDCHGTATISAGRGSGPNPLTALCREHGLWGRRSGDKCVPDAIFRLTDAQIARFLAVLFACDGHVYASPRLRQIGYTTISHRLAHDVQHLMLRLGIVATIRTLKRAVYEGTGTRALEVRITGRAGLDAFARLVRVVGKEDRLERVLSGGEACIEHTNTDTLPPAVWRLVLAAKADRPWATISTAAGRPRNHNWHVHSRGVSRAQLATLAAATGSADLGALAASDVWWDEVASIEPIGEQETYDLDIPGTRNFVADDIVVHNSALMANFAENAALNSDRAVALFTLEMSEGELAQRIIASQA